MKNKMIIAGCLMSASTQLVAAPISLNTGLWTSEISPSSERDSAQWVKRHSQTPTQRANLSGTLVSDFSLDGDFTFEGVFMPTFSFASSCATEDNGTCDDDDILGLVFGWQDKDNHYRLGWSQGDGTNPSGVKDVTGKTGLFLVKEEDGKSNTLHNWDSLFWQEDIEYTFSIGRVADSISIMVEGLMQSVRGIQQGDVPTPDRDLLTSQVVDFSTTDTTFTSGRVGVYTESQTAVFSGLTVNVPDEPEPPITTNVTAPATLGLFALASFGLMINRQRKKALALD